MLWRICAVDQLQVAWQWFKFEIDHLVKRSHDIILFSHWSIWSLNVYGDCLATSKLCGIPHNCVNFGTHDIPMIPEPMMELMKLKLAPPMELELCCLPGSISWRTLASVALSPSSSSYDCDNIVSIMGNPRLNSLADKVDTTCIPYLIQWNPSAGTPLKWGHLP